MSIHIPTDSVIKTTTPIFNKIGEPFKYKIIETGIHGTCAWSLDNTGHLYIYPRNGNSGVLESQVSFLDNKYWNPYSEKIFYVTVKDGVVANKNASFLFARLPNCLIIEAEKLDVSNTISFTCMFEGCSKLKKVDIHGWNTENAKDFGGMFYDCLNLEWIIGDFRGFNTSNTKNMSGMFYNCRSLEFLNLNSFNIKNVQNLSHMFANCISLKRLMFKALKEQSLPDFCQTNDMFKRCLCKKTHEPFNKKCSQLICKIKEKRERDYYKKQAEIIYEQNKYKNMYNNI